MELIKKKPLLLLLISVFLLAAVVGIPAMAASQNDAPAAVAGEAGVAAPSGVYVSSVEFGECGPIDLTIALDDTGSMGGAIANIKTELPNIIAAALHASGDDLKVGYMTFKDNVTVHNQLTTDIAAVNASILATSATGGFGGPEASDEAKNTAVNNLPGGLRNDSTGYTGMQNGDYTEAYRAGALKLVVLITDAPPGGFNDIQDADDNESLANTHANTALANGIKVSDVFVPTGGDYAGQAALLKSDADITGGLFIKTAPNGTGTGEAITAIIEACGEAKVLKAACVETVNPAGKNIPPAGKTTLPGAKGGQNEDGFYELLAKDTDDPNPQIFVQDSASGVVFGPFASGDKIKYTEANGATPNSKPIGGPNSAIASHIIGNGDALVYAVNAAGDVSEPVSCLVPPLPK